jgi:hypothetical protein
MISVRFLNRRPGQRYVLHSGALHFQPHVDRKLSAIEAWRKGLAAATVREGFLGKTILRIAPQARFELAALRLTVAASIFTTGHDGLLSRWFNARSQVIRRFTPFIRSATVCYGKGHKTGDRG